MSFDYSVLEGLKILVVDDNDDTCELITLALELYSIEVTAVRSVSEALAQLKIQQPDLVISDIAMPKEDGYSFIRQLRGLDASQGGTLPAIALTAYTGQNEAEGVLAAGFQKYIPKPVEPDNLIAEIVELVFPPCKSPSLIS